MSRRAHKFGAIRTETRDGISHPSRKQARRWEELRLLERAGEISGLQREVTIPLIGRDGPLRSPSGRALHYRCDFVFVDKRTGAITYEDAKGFETPEFKLKRAILAAQGVTVVTT